MERLLKIFNKFSVIVFASCVIIAAYSTIVYKSSYKYIAVFGILISAAAAFFLGKLEKKLSSISVYQYRRITAVFCILLLASQIITASLADLTPKNDLAYVCAGAKNLILGNDIYAGIPSYHNNYFEVYPNNHLLFAVIYMLYKTEYVISGNITDFLPTAVNIAGLALSYFMMCRCAELVHSPSKALICAIRGMLFTPMITYSLFFYTDSMSMPIIMCALYFYLKYRQDKRFALLIICGALIGIAYKMKGSAIILLIAIMLDMAVNRESFCNYISAAIPCLAVCKIISAICLHLLKISVAQLKEKAFPIIHWIMMSADGRGGYNSEDFLFTQSLSLEGRNHAILMRLSNKLKEQGFFGFLNHIAEKIAYTWQNFTFMAGYYHNGDFNSNVFYAASFLCHFTILFSILGSLLNFAELKKDTVVFRLCLVGICIFLIIWEARCRYLVSFFPIFMLI